MIGVGAVGVWPVAGAPDDGAPSGPVVVRPGRFCAWTVAVRVGGTDVSHLLSGSVSIDREEGSAGIATFNLFYPPGETVPTSMPNNRVEVDFVAEVDGDGVQSRLFTGFIAEPRWSADTRVMAITCTDRLQQRIESMSVAEIDALALGSWSADVFEPVEGRSRYDYAMERISTEPVSLDTSAMGEIRRTSWFATAPAFLFGHGSTIFRSVSIDLAQPFNSTNRGEVVVRYRYNRVWQLNQLYTWKHPGAHSAIGIPGFCEWRVWSTDVPDVQLVQEAIDGSGQVLIGSPVYDRIPTSAPDPCGNGNPWVNNYPDFLLGIGLTTARRWVQTITEEYTLTLATASGMLTDQQVITRESVQFEIEDTRLDDWENSLEGKGSGVSDTDPPALPAGVPSAGWVWNPASNGAAGYNDITSEPRRTGALLVMLRRMQVELIKAHRGTTVSWSVPTSHALGVDLVHTLELDDQYAKARGKCRRIQHRLDMDSGEASTQISIAVMRGGGLGDPLDIPARPDMSLPPLAGAASGIGMQTQIGGRLHHPPGASGPVDGGPVEPFDDSIVGFAGNYSVSDDLTAEKFPYRFKLPHREVPAAYTDELVRSAERLYRVSIPNDLLEL